MVASQVSATWREEEEAPESWSGPFVHSVFGDGWSARRREAQSSSAGGGDFCSCFPCPRHPGVARTPLPVHNTRGV